MICRMGKNYNNFYNYEDVDKKNNLLGSLISTTSNDEDAQQSSSNTSIISKEYLFER